MGELFIAHVRPNFTHRPMIHVGDGPEGHEGIAKNFSWLTIFDDKDVEVRCQ